MNKSAMIRRMKSKEPAVRQVTDDGMPQEKDGKIPGPPAHDTQDNEDGPASTTMDHINAAIEALNHPDVHPAVAAMASPSLLGVKHFGGPHPAIDAAHKSGKHPNISHMQSSESDPTPSIDGSPEGQQE